jgi:hypothetical protein
VKFASPLGHRALLDRGGFVRLTAVSPMYDPLAVIALALMALAALLAGVARHRRVGAFVVAIGAALIWLRGTNVTVGFGMVVAVAAVTKAAVAHRWWSKPIFWPVSSIVIGASLATAVGLELLRTLGAEVAFAYGAVCILAALTRLAWSMARWARPTPSASASM